MKNLFLFLISFGIVLSCKAQSNLETAIISSDTVSIQQFLDSEKDIDGLHIRDTYTGLNFAVKYERQEIVGLFLKQGANPNLETNGKSPLMYAAKYGKLEIAKLLIQNGANKDYANAKGRTALDYARKYQQAELVNFLKQ